MFVKFHLHIAQTSNIKNFIWKHYPNIIKSYQFNNNSYNILDWTELTGRKSKQISFLYVYLGFLDLIIHMIIHRIMINTHGILVILNKLHSGEPERMKTDI